MAFSPEINPLSLYQLNTEYKEEPGDELDIDGDNDGCQVRILQTFLMANFEKNRSFYN